MVQKYKSSDIDLFTKINISKKNSYFNTKSNSKELSNKPKFTYQNKDDNKFKILENSLVDSNYTKKINKS